MTVIDGATVDRPQGHPESLDTPLPEVMVEFESEFFVEWQVADGGLLSPASEEQILPR